MRNELGRFDALVIGAGVAGLTAAAELSKSGLRTCVVERHNVPGGCASFYLRDGYRFDVGATLVGGFGFRGVHRLLNERYGIEVSSAAIEPSMVVHLPDVTVVRYGDDRWPGERLRAFGFEAESFWHAQEHIADLTWDLSTRFPALPVDRPSLLALARAVRPRNLGLLGALGRSVASILPPTPSRRLRAFVDAQLLITAQTDADGADLSYGATALDLAREGTFHLSEGVSTIAVALARATRRAGGTILYKTDAAAIKTERGRVRGVRLGDGRLLSCDRVVSALPVQNTAALCAPLERAYRARLAALPQRWGAFMLYCALPEGVVPTDLAAHHQLIDSYDAPPGEGNTTFLSFSGPDERHRAPVAGARAVTISTHSDVARWERAYADGAEGALRAVFTGRLLAALDRVVPGASSRAVFIEAATPHTFASYTERYRGLVGGLPQTPALQRLFTQRTPVRGLYLCGDTTFPGQSTVGATLSGINAARSASAR